MERLSAFKHGVKSALHIPRDGFKPQSRRQVISFAEALESLKASQSGFVTCGAFNSFGRCRKKIIMDDSNLLASLGQFDITDIQTPIKLMPLMLCPTHWGKTVCYNALFLDWLSKHGSKQNDIQFENIVVDYESAIVIDNQENSSFELTIFSGSAPEDRGRPVSAPNSRINDSNHLQNSDQPDQLLITNDHVVLTPSEPESLCVAQNLSELSVSDMDSYASIELGVVNLEILYQEHLKCIAMTSNGWRCPTTIHENELLQARELLRASATSETELDMELLPRLVLCQGHARGILPRIYSEKWAAFSEQRLPKDEAMSKFNADFWMSIQFFSNDGKETITSRAKSPNRPRSASSVSAKRRERFDPRSIESIGGNFLKPDAAIQFNAQRENFEFSFAPAPVDRAIQTTNRNTQSGINRSPGFAAVINQPISLEKNKGAPVYHYSASKNLSSSERNDHQSKQMVSPDVIDRNMIQTMSSQVPAKPRVIIFTSRNRNLCKIGKATDVDTLKQQIQAKCQIQDFAEVEVKAIRTEYPERVTKLVHLELQNFRAKLSCEGVHHLRGSNEALEQAHGEWFDVTESVALLSVYVWTDFVYNAYKSDGTIKEAWAKRLTLMPKPSSKETELLEKVLKDRFAADGLNSIVDTYHNERYTRYRAWVKEGVSEDV